MTSVLLATHIQKREAAPTAVQAPHVTDTHPLAEIMQIHAECKAN
jgi:hypothetical protein